MQGSNKVREIKEYIRNSLYASLKQCLHIACKVLTFIDDIRLQNLVDFISSHIKDLNHRFLHYVKIEEDKNSNLLSHFQNSNVKGH